MFLRFTIFNDMLHIICLQAVVSVSNHRVPTSQDYSRLGRKYNTVLGEFGDPRAILKRHYAFFFRSAVQITELRSTVHWTVHVTEN